MPTKNFPLNTLEQALSVLAACRQVDTNIKAGTMTQPELADEIAQTQADQSLINDLEFQLTKLRSKRDTRLTGIWENIKRLRTTVKGMFGDDSSEYKLVGGTRMSDRKRAARKHTDQPNAKPKAESQEARAEG